jgi:hypothetical protein
MEPWAMKRDAKPGEGQPLPGMPVQEAVKQWAMGKLVDYRQTAELGTAIVNDLDLETLCVVFAPADDSALCLMIDADTYHGGHFQQIIAWSPIHAGSVVSQIVKAAGGVVHA